MHTDYKSDPVFASSCLFLKKQTSKGVLLNTKKCVQIFIDQLSFFVGYTENWCLQNKVASGYYLGSSISHVESDELLKMSWNHYISVLYMYLTLLREMYVSYMKKCLLRTLLPSWVVADWITRDVSCT